MTMPSYFSTLSFYCVTMREILQLTQGYEAAQEWLKIDKDFQSAHNYRRLVSTLFNCHYNGFLVIQTFTVCAIKDKNYGLYFSQFQ
jgi:hypothetical protein